MSARVINSMKAALKAKANLIVTGTHGVGKSEIITALFNEEFGEGNWAYFSGATMDAFVDFIGCPKETQDDDGVRYLDMVRPKRFAKHKVKAIFMDEYNRAPKQVRNALMELIQFKTINGETYPELELVWAAVNPSDDEYDVEEIDPAQFDRFHIQIKMDSNPNQKYFCDKYGNTAGIAACDWWSNLPTEIRKLVSPRRLDYAIGLFINHGINMRDVLDPRIKVDSLVSALKEDPLINTLRNLKKQADSGKSRKKLDDFLSDEENFYSCKDFMTKEDNICAYIDHFPQEKIGEHLSKSGSARTIYDQMAKSGESSTNFFEVVISQYEAGLNKAILEQFAKDDIDYMSSIVKAANERMSSKK